jgi:uncharacterized membrane protein YwzB
MHSNSNFFFKKGLLGQAALLLITVAFLVGNGGQTATCTLNLVLKKTPLEWW